MIPTYTMPAVLANTIISLSDTTTSTVLSKCRRHLCASLCSNVASFYHYALCTMTIAYCTSSTHQSRLKPQEREHHRFIPYCTVVLTDESYILQSCAVGPIIYTCITLASVFFITRANNSHPVSELSGEFLSTQLLLVDKMKKQSCYCTHSPENWKTPSKSMPQ